MSNYWAKRQKQLKKSLTEDEAKLKARLSKFYEAESKRLEQEIASYYARYGADNVIEYRKMMESLSDADKSLLFEKYDEFAKKYPEYAHLMPVRESIYKLDRLQGLQYSIQLQQLQIGAKEIELTTEHLLKNGVKALAAAQKVMGIGTMFQAMNENIVRTFVDSPWCNGQKFSERIWGNKTKLTNYLSTDIAQGFARGDSYQRLTKAITARFGKVSRNDAYRLIYTEGTYVMAESSMQPFKDDFQFYKISTVGDNKVCPICSAMAEHTFEIANRVPGENFPPFHSWCRCTFEIVVDDWDEWMDDYVKRHGDQETAEMIHKQFAKSITMDDFEFRMRGKNVDEEVSNIIYNTIKAYESKGGMYISEIHTGSFIDEATGKPALMQVFVNPQTNLVDMNINTEFLAGKSIEEINLQIKSTKVNIVETLEEATIHECGHAKSFYKLNYEEQVRLDNEFKERGVTGISGIAKGDGLEAVAEIEVLKSRGGAISEEAEKLYDEVMNWRKKK